MTDKALQDKAISIRGKDYVQVKDRINYFNENYPNGSIQTTLVSDNEKVVFRAKVTPDCDKLDRYFTGTSASNPSKTIEAQVPHEVAETSAVGRALAMMGIGVIDSVASADEMRKAGVSEKPQKDNLTATCKVHNAPMVQKWSETKQKMYWFHRDNQGMCFGKGYLEKK